LNPDKWTLSASRDNGSCLLEPTESQHDSETAARVAWAGMAPHDDYFDAYIFPPQTIGGNAIVLKAPGA